MGKKDKNKKKGLGIEKTTAKTDKKALAKQKKLIQKLGEEDIEKIVASLESSNTTETTELPTANPSPRTNVSICSIEDVIYIHGGEFFNGNKTETYGEFYSYHTIKNEWKLIKASPAPCARSAAQMISTAQNGGEIWMFGGEFASPSQLQFYHFKDTWRYQLSTKKWEKFKTPISPSARSGHRMVLSKKRIILFGGFHDTNNSYQYFNDVWCFSLENYNWTKIDATGTAPIARSSVIIGATEDGKIIIHGGYTKTSAKGDAERGITHADTFVLQEIEGKWKWNSCKPGGRRPTPRSAVASTVASNGRVFTFGGVMDTEEDDEDVRGQFSNEIHFLETSGGGIAWRKVELKAKKGEHGKTDTEMKSEEKPETKTFDDGVFKITIGGSSSSKAAESSTPKLEINGPSPRMNAGLVLVRHNLFVFGGSYEQGSRLFTLNDFHSLDINKLDSWKTHVGNLPSLAWFGSDSEDSSSEGSEGDEDSDEASDSDEMDTD